MQDLALSLVELYEVIIVAVIHIYPLSFSLQSETVLIVSSYEVIWEFISIFVKMKIEAFM